MTQTKYSKLISTDTLNGSVAINALTKQIQESTIVIALDYISTMGDVLDIYFKDVLSAPDQASLITLLAAHDGVEIEEHDKIDAEVKSTPAFASKTLPDGRKLNKRVHGSNVTAIANSTTSLDFTIPYAEAKFTGAEIFGCDLGDTINFKIIDTAAGSYSTVPNYMLNQFGFDVEMPSGGIYKNTSNYDASLHVGMILRCEYTNNGGSDKYISMNAWLHEVV